MRAAAVAPSGNAAAVNQSNYASDKESRKWLFLVPVTERFRPRGGSPIYGRSTSLLGGLLAISMESLILAQDERWRRA